MLRIFRLCVCNPMSIHVITWCQLHHDTGAAGMHITVNVLLQVLSECFEQEPDLAMLPLTDLCNHSSHAMTSTRPCSLPLHMRFSLVALNTCFPSLAEHLPLAVMSDRR